MGTDRLQRNGAEARDPRASNAVTHGLTGAHVLEQEQAQYDAALAELLQLWEPVGPHEGALARRIAHLTVRLDRAGSLERSLYAECYSPDGFNQLMFERLAATVGRYERAIARALAKTAHELERLQKTRRGEPVPSPSIVDFNW